MEKESLEAQPRRSILRGRRTASIVAAGIFDQLVADKAFSCATQHQPEELDTQSEPTEPQIPPDEALA